MSRVTDEEFDSVFEEDHLRNYLNRVSNTLKISRPKYFVELGTKTGVDVDYIGVAYRVSIEGNKNGVPVRYDTILKIPPIDEEQRRVGSVSDFFSREHYFYTEIVPAFNEFLKIKNKTLGNIARCYFSSDADHKEVKKKKNINKFNKLKIRSYFRNEIDKKKKIM